MVAYDVELADRLRDLLAAEPEVVEKRMFGGLAFMVAGHMAVAATSHGVLMLRVDPAESEALVLEPGVRRMVMQGRELNGWLEVETDGASDEDLGRWVDLGVDHVRSLAPK